MFKRANRELAKQSIGGDDFDPEAIDEVLAGVSSDESDDDSDMELTPSTQTSNNKRKYASHQDSDDSDDDSEDDSNQDEEDAVVSEEDDEETELVYNCDVCPEKRLTSEKHVAEHLQSKTHLRRAKIASKNDNIKNLSPKDLEKRNEQLEKAKLDRQEKIRQRIKAKRAAKQARAYLRKHPEAATNKEVKETDKQPTDTKTKDTETKVTKNKDTDKVKTKNDKPKVTKNKDTDNVKIKNDKPKAMNNTKKPKANKSKKIKK